MSFSIPQRTSHCRLGMSADQLNPTPGTTVAFNTEDAASGHLSRSGSTITGFQAGKVYLLTANLAITYSATCSATFEFYDVTGAAAIQVWDIRAPNSGNNYNQGGVGVAVFVPSVDTSVRIDLTQITAGADIQGVSAGYAEPFFCAVELGQA